jgi:hypothetical protein
MTHYRNRLIFPLPFRGTLDYTSAKTPPILRMPTNFAGVFGRSFAARTPAKARALAVLNETGMYPLSKDPRRAATILIVKPLRKTDSILLA